MPAKNFILITKKVVTRQIAIQILHKSELAEVKRKKDTYLEDPAEVYKTMLSGLVSHLAQPFVQIFHDQLKEGRDELKEIIESDTPSCLTMVEIIDLQKEGHEHEKF